MKTARYKDQNVTRTQPSSAANWLAYGMYSLVALAVMLPLLKPGFILTLDMIFVPNLRLPDTVTSSYPFHALLYFLNSFIPADVLQKIMLLGIFILASIGMHRLIRLLNPQTENSDWGIYLASVFFAINPFTYGRFMAGQYAVLLGYALLPWLVRLLLKFLSRPSLVGGLKLGGLTAVIGAVSIHTLGAVAIMAVVAIGLIVWRYRQKLRNFAKYGAVAIGLFIALSSYWLVPLALGQGKTADIVSSFTVADSQAFESRGSNPAVRLAHILRLEGFWLEDRQQFLLPQDKAMLWGLMALVILALIVFGAIRLWRKNQALAVFFVVSAVVSALIAAGVLGDVPRLVGLREPHKLVGLVAVVYAILLAFGTNSLLDRLRQKQEVLYGISAVVLLLIPFLFMRVMFWGFAGQLTPAQYPADWVSVNQRLQQDTDKFEVLFLPWHQYMHFDFAGRIIANPAPLFFDKPTIVSTDPELDGATSGQQNERTQQITHLLAAGKTHTNLATDLAVQNIKYIIVAKEVDYQEYDFISTQPDLQQIDTYDTLIVYQNNAWSRP